jgi:hypothetical protein
VKETPYQGDVKETLSRGNVKGTASPGDVNVKESLSVIFFLAFLG